MVTINSLRGRCFRSFDDKIVTVVTDVNQNKKLVRGGDGTWYTLHDFLLLFIVE